ncbi:MAG: DEAD/DEAH box helicase family protein [bacterium]
MAIMGAGKGGSNTGKMPVPPSSEFKARETAPEGAPLIGVIETPAPSPPSDNFVGAPPTSASAKPTKALAQSVRRFSAAAPGSGPHTSFPGHAEMFQEYEDMIRRIALRVEKWKGRYGAASHGPVEDLQRRLDRIKAQAARAIESGADEGYLEDVVDATRILWNRVLKTEREFFAGAHSGRGFRVHLHDYTPDDEPMHPRGTRRPGTRTRTRIGTTVTSGQLIPALRNEERVDMSIGLRPHQWEMIDAIQRDWGEHETHGDEPWKEGVVVAPTGSGKTHVMGASIELGIREGWLNFTAGSKVVIFTHLKQIKEQNLARMQELLDPVFQSLYGRAARITAIGEGQWDASGDVVVASVPTVGRNLERFSDALRSTPTALVLADEYHHADAASWQKSRKAIETVVPHGYAMGFTATLPPQERPSTNIVSEHAVREMMQVGVIPAVDLIQVRTGVSLERIPTNYGSFNSTELSKTVRNPERYEHMMRALEFGGVRGERGGVAPTLIFTVDRAHAHETAYFYQGYFTGKRKAHQTEDGTTIRPMGQRNIAVMGESATLKEVHQLLKAYRTRTPTEFDRYAYGAPSFGNGNTAYYASGKVRERIDGIVAVITAQTPTPVRQALIQASEHGEVETIVNVRALGEGLDAPWIQNLIGASPTLVSDSSKMVQRAQEVGRMLRWGRDEVDDAGKLLRPARDRVAIDLIDDTSIKRPLTRYFETLGLGDAHERGYGVRIDVKNGIIRSQAYGGIKDVFELDEQGGGRARSRGPRRRRNSPRLRGSAGICCCRMMWWETLHATCEPSFAMSIAGISRACRSILESQRNRSWVF